MITPEIFLERVGALPIIAVLRWHERDVARDAMAAAVAGGLTTIEFTLNTEGAYDLIGEFAKDSSLVVGAGTVLQPDQAVRAVSIGSQFLVSPVVDEQVIGCARELGVAIVPGAHTPSEMLRAYRLGAQLQKLFPAPGIGPEFIRACLGPLPFLRIVPTHGVDLDNARSWFDAGAFAVGFVASLFSPEYLRDRRYSAIEGRAKTIRQLIERHVTPRV